jgi:hypothetical protein
VFDAVVYSPQDNMELANEYWHRPILLYKIQGGNSDGPVLFNHDEKINEVCTRLPVPSLLWQYNLCSAFIFYNHLKALLLSWVTILHDN